MKSLERNCWFRLHVFTPSERATFADFDQLRGDLQKLDRKGIQTTLEPREYYLKIL